MKAVETLFWISFSLLFFCYLGYAGLLFLLNSIKRFFSPRRKNNTIPELLPATLIVASYNEEAVLDEKIKNTLAIDYPAGRLEIIFIVDGATDSSADIIKKYPSIQLIQLQQRAGKYAAMKTAMKQVKSPVVVFSDANAMLNKECLLKIMPHFSDPRTGGVAGEKKVFSTKHHSAVGKGEGFYWKYESFIKQQDSDFNTVVGAAGELFAIRTELFTGPDKKIILDDFIISMNVCLQGYSVIYEPGAYAEEKPSRSILEEKKRKTRIAAGAFQSIHYLKQTLNVLKRPVLAFQFLFHRLLRWTACPFLLPLLFLTNLLLVAGINGNSLYVLSLALQFLFYLAASGGWIRVNRGKHPGAFTIPYYFVFMNYCLVAGLLQYLRGTYTVLWEKSLRETES